MTSSKPLSGTRLIDCAKASANKDIEVVSEICGYGKDVTTFEQELKKACDSIGVKIESFNDLKKTNQNQQVEIAPESPNQF